MLHAVPVDAQPVRPTDQCKLAHANKKTKKKKNTMAKGPAPKKKNKTAKGPALARCCTPKAQAAPVAGDDFEVQLAAARDIAEAKASIAAHCVS